MARSVVGVVVSLAMLAAATPANAQDVGKARILSSIKVQGAHASLKVRYQCATGTHIWVSAKQTASDSRLARALFCGVRSCSMLLSNSAIVP